MLEALLIAEGALVTMQPSEVQSIHKVSYHIAQLP